jgi:hypothetical protein
MWNSHSQRFNCRGVRAAGTPAIAAPGALYAVDFSQLMKNAELLPPAAADCAAGKIDEHREDESSELRRQPVHGTGAPPERLIREAIELHLERLREDGTPIPPPSSRVDYAEVAA